MLRALILSTTMLIPLGVSSQESVCYGSTASGSLDGGVKLPGEGPNFVSYSAVAGLIGRTYVHSSVRDIIVAAYKALETEQPGTVFKYAETGLSSGGTFRPHRTHQNGLSVDFMVPVIDENGESIQLPTHPFNKLGYSIEFDKAGVYEQYHIDYDAMAAHIAELHQQATSRGFGLWRVIFDPDMQKYLFSTEYGHYLQANVQFSERPSWVRHDEHYHVDFEIPCRELRR